MLDIVRCSTGNFLKYFPQWTTLFNETSEKFQTFLEFVEQTYRQLQGLERKEFAAEAKKLPFKGILFEFIDDGISDIRKYFALCPLQKLESLMKKTEIYRAKERQ